MANMYWTIEARLTLVAPVLLVCRVLHTFMFQGAWSSGLEQCAIKYL